MLFLFAKISSMRLYNFLKNKYNLTKSETKDFYNNHLIYINESKATLLSLINENDIICIDGKTVNTNIDYVYYAFYKPIGVECTCNTNIENNIKTYTNIKIRVFPIGRLDKDSEGLILLTNDQEICNKVLNKDNHIEKEYIVSVDKVIDDDFIYNMSNGVEILNTKTQKCTVKKIDDYTFDIILNEGMNRQIRRMCKALGYNVTNLKRVRFGAVNLDLEIGEIRKIKISDFCK